MAKKIYDSVLGRLAVEVPLFAESILNKALAKIGTNPSDVTAFQMKNAIEQCIEPMLRKNLGLRKGIREMGVGIIVLDSKGKIRSTSPIIHRLLPNLKNKKFVIKKDLTVDIIRSKDKSVKILTIPIINESGEIEGAVCLVSDTTLDTELNKEIDSTYNQVLKQNKELIKFAEELRKSKKKLESNVDEMERFSKLSVGRELKMVELKKRIKVLEGKLKKHGIEAGDGK